MALTPQQVYEIRFDRAMRGYNIDDVDTFLDEIIEELERRDAKEKQMGEQIAQLKSECESMHEMETALREALVLAQKRSDEIIREAQAQAEDIRSQARQEAEKITAATPDMDAYRQRMFDMLSELSDMLDAQKETMMRYPVHPQQDAQNVQGAQQYARPYPPQPYAPGDAPRYLPQDAPRDARQPYPPQDAQADARQSYPQRPVPRYAQPPFGSNSEQLYARQPYAQMQTAPPRPQYAQSEAAQQDAYVQDAPHNEGF